jgi:hypothetical protein
MAPVEGLVLNIAGNHGPDFDARVSKFSFIALFKFLLFAKNGKAKSGAAVEMLPLD